MSIGLPKLPPMKEKASRRNNTPLWCVSSPMNQSVTGACGEAAFKAGCPLAAAIRA